MDTAVSGSVHVVLGREVVTPLTNSIWRQRRRRVAVEIYEEKESLRYNVLICQVTKADKQSRSFSC